MLVSDSESVLSSGARLDHGVLVSLEPNGHMSGDVEPLLQDVSEHRMSLYKLIRMHMFMHYDIYQEPSLTCFTFRKTYNIYIH